MGSQVKAQYKLYNKFGSPNLYFDKAIPKSAELKLISRTQLSSMFNYPSFYFNEVQKELYLYNSLEIVPTKSFEKDPNVLLPKQDDKVVEIDAADALPASNKDYVKIIPDANNVVLKIPEHHGKPDKVLILNVDKKTFNTKAFVNSLNNLGLQKIRKSPAYKGTDTHYDRLFINTEGKDKILIIWQKHHQVFANFLSSKGKWLYDTPKIIHQEVICNKDSLSFQRNAEDIENNYTLVNELNSIKSGDKYIVTYSIHIWASSDCFKKDKTTIHNLILNNNLEVEKRTQMPENIGQIGDSIFDSTTEVKSYLQNDILYNIAYSTPFNRGEMFISCYDKNLNSVGGYKYLSNTVLKNKNIITAVKLNEGLLITYKNIENKNIDLYSQLIAPDGTPSLPISMLRITEADGNKYMNHFIQKDNHQLFYYLVVRENDISYLYKYGINVNNLLEQNNYIINKDNWLKDKQIIEVNTLVQQIETDINNKSLTRYRKELPNLIKEAFIDQQLFIRKYIRDYVQRNQPKVYPSISNYYYDGFGKLRCVVEQVPSENYKITHYYNKDRKNFWNVWEENNTIKFSTQFFNKSNTYESIYLSPPFDDFHAAY
ncbi:hypothetical protein GCM10027442_30150 [Emticicia fontis]